MGKERDEYEKRETGYYKLHLCQICLNSVITMGKMKPWNTCRNVETDILLQQYFYM